MGPPNRRNGIVRPLGLSERLDSVYAYCTIPSSMERNWQRQYGGSLWGLRLQILTVLYPWVSYGYAKPKERHRSTPGTLIGDPKNGRIPYIYVRLLPCALEGENGATSIVCPESPSLYIVKSKDVLESQEIDLSKLFSEYTTKC